MFNFEAYLILNQIDADSGLPVLDTLIVNPKDKQTNK